MNFDDIRAYKDEEYQFVINKLIQVESLIEAIQFYLPELTHKQIKEKLQSFTTIQDFQSEMVCMLVGKIVNHSAKSITFKGIKTLSKSTNYLFISNHRDIVLDSALINYGLNLNNFNTSEIAIGSNLLSKPWIKDLVRINKSFIVKRNVPKQEMLAASKTLSAYINQTLSEKNQSIWIAQREGRAKDGFDKTNPSLLKMLGLCNTDDLLTYIMRLNITPVSISYEYDPCDYLKINELIKKHHGESYQKAENEDNQHMLLGIKGYKGNINIHFDEPINEKIAAFSVIKNKNDLLKEIANVIDNQIYKHYYLFASHYVAYDLLHNSNTFKNKYTIEEKNTFIAYVDKRLADFKNNALAKEIFLKMYAYPVINRIGIKELGVKQKI